MTQNIHIYLNIQTDFYFVCNHIFNTFLKNTIKGRHPIDSDASLFCFRFQVSRFFHSCILKAFSKKTMTGFILNP